jgi:uncharacterized protein YegL
MRDNFSDISIVLDRSGSMEAVADDTIGGFNRFLLDQKQAPGDGVLTLVQFDTMYEFVHQAKPLAEVPPLDRKTFVPRGSTALLDAIGRTINETVARLEKTDESQLPGTVIFVILTDGQENSSREFSRDMVFKQIKEQQEKRKWQFVFLGANQDAIAEAGMLGVPAGSSLTYAHNAAGSKAAFESLSRHTRVLRAKMASKFTDEDREEQKRSGLKS